MYHFDQKPGTRIAEASVAILQQIRDSQYSVLVGRNNSGKSYLLKLLTSQWGAKASYLGPQRYQNFNLLGSFTPNRNRRKDQKWTEFYQQWNRHETNIDNSPVNLQQAIAELSNTQRDHLFEIVETLLGTRLEILPTVDDNAMSQKYISAGGHNISYTSSGFRLVTTLIAGLLDTEYDTVLIDEPELGISPEAQGVLADFLFDRSSRAKYFPHIKTLILATHSTVFLDRLTISNNYTVEKRGDEIFLYPTTTQADLNSLHFFLLGNRFETLFLPSAIILVEGKTDHKFVQRSVALHLPGARISVINATNDSRMLELLHFANGMLSDLQNSPYRDRLFVVLDEVHQADIPHRLERMGVRADSIIKWSRNGIEFVYPPQLLERIYGAGGELTITGDLVGRNGIVLTKGELCDRIINSLDSTTTHAEEFIARLLQPLSQRLA